MNTTSPVILFDLHGTLTEGTLPLDYEMADLLRQLLTHRTVGVTSGYTMNHFRKQVVAPLFLSNADLSHLFFAPLMGTEFYLSTGCAWKECVFRMEISEVDRDRIRASIGAVSITAGYPTSGDVVDDRGGQVAYAVIGLSAPLEVKMGWDKDLKKRTVLAQRLRSLLPDFEVAIGGHTTITVSPKGVDKTQCLLRIKDFLGRDKSDIVYIANAFGKGGDDQCMMDAGVACIPVSSLEETKRAIREILRG